MGLSQQIILLSEIYLTMPILLPWMRKAIAASERKQPPVVVSMEIPTVPVAAPVVEVPAPVVEETAVPVVEVPAPVVEETAVPVVEVPAPAEETEEHE